MFGVSSKSFLDLWKKGQRGCYIVRRRHQRGGWRVWVKIFETWPLDRVICEAGYKPDIDFKDFE